MNTVEALLGHTDIYLIDQMMKGRYQPGAVILDAGAGGGRNLHWFVREGYTVFGTDRNPEAVAALRQSYPETPETHFLLAPVENMPFADAAFDHVLCSAVLHFADNARHFENMVAELVRVLRPGGTIFLRVATDIGMEDQIIPLGNGRFLLPDGSERFLLTNPMLRQLLQRHGLQLLEPFKTVVVENTRSMAAVVLGKSGPLAG